MCELHIKPAHITNDNNVYSDCGMYNTWPFHVGIQDIQIGIADELHINAVEAFSVDVFMFVDCWRYNFHMRAINASNDIRKTRHCKK